MEYNTIQRARVERTAKLSQTQIYLRAARDAYEVGDKEEEAHWRDKTLRTLEEALLGNWIPITDTVTLVALY